MNDGEMDVHNVAEEQEMQYRSVQSSGCEECSGCGEAWQFEVVWASGAKECE